MKKKSLALLSAVFILVVLLFSFLFILVEADHDCHGDDCPICKIVAIAQNVVRGIAAGGLSSALLIAFILAANKYLFPTEQKRRYVTPVSLRVKLTE